jgi:hypothetical protein
MNIHDEMTDSEVLRAATEFLSRIPMAAPPDVEAITARGHARRNRRLASAAGLSVAAAATALALSLTGVLGPSRAKAPGTIRTMSFTLVSHNNGTVTLTINRNVLFDATALQNDLHHDGIPALVTSGSFCGSNPAPAGLWQVVSGSIAPPPPGTRERVLPPGPPTITFNPAAIPAGAELSIGDFQPSSSTQQASLTLIYAKSYTCTSDPNLGPGAGPVAVLLNTPGLAGTGPGRPSAAGS